MGVPRGLLKLPEGELICGVKCLPDKMPRHLGAGNLPLITLLGDSMIPVVFFFLIALDETLYK